MSTAFGEQNFGFLLTDVSRLMRKRFAQRARDVCLTGAQWRVLVHLARMPGVNQATLADFLDVEPISLTRLLDRMEASGLVRREISPHDRRVRNLYMTDRAEPVMADLKKISTLFLNDLFADIDAADLEATMRVLNALRNQLQDPGCDGGG